MSNEVQSLKIVNRYDSHVVLYDSKAYPEFKGDSWNGFVLFLVYKRANLFKADLSEANLSEANLTLFSKWSIKYELPNLIKIGCKTKTIKEWDYWFKNSTEEFDSKRDSNTFKRIYANYLGVREYLKECQKQKLFKKEVDENNNIKWFAE